MNNQFYMYPFDVMGISIPIKLKKLNDYLMMMESFFACEASNFHEQVQELEDEEIDRLSDNYWELKEFQNIFRASFFIACFSFLEYELMHLCEALKEFNRKLPELSDLEGNTIENAQKFLKNNVGMDKFFPDHSSPHWSHIKHYITLRNVIVHNSASLNISEKSRHKRRIEKLKSYIKEKTSLELNDFNNIQFTKAFLNEVLQTLEKFLEEFVKGFKEWRKSDKNQLL